MKVHELLEGWMFWNNTETVEVCEYFQNGYRPKRSEFICECLPELILNPNASVNILVKNLEVHAFSWSRGKLLIRVKIEEGSKDARTRSDT